MLDRDDDRDERLCTGSTRPPAAAAAVAAAALAATVALAWLGRRKLAAAAVLAWSWAVLGRRWSLPSLTLTLLRLSGLLVSLVRLLERRRDQPGQMGTAG